MAFTLHGLPIMFFDGIYHVAATRVGQTAISLVDRFLCIIEGLNFYAAPEAQQQESRQQSKEMYYYQRPLPWFLFIPMLFYFRILRNVLTLFFWLLGRETVSPMTVVYYMQGMRRKLRYIKIEGSRMMNDSNRVPSQLPLLARIALNLFTWGPLQFVTVIARLVMGDKQYNTYNLAGPPPSKRSLKKLKDADNNECTTDELLDKFAEEDDNDPMNDSDFKVKVTDLETETDEEEGDEENSEPEEDAGVIRGNGANTSGNKDGGGGENQDQQRNDETNGQPANMDNQNHEEHHQNYNDEHHNH